MNSKGILYIDCPEQDKKNAFSAKELTEDEYVKMLREYSMSIGMGISHNDFNSRHNVYEINDNEEKINYSKSSAIIYNMKGEKCDIKELYRIQKNGMGILIIELLESEMEDTFESEFKFWKKDSMNINNDKNIDKDDRIRFLPIKDLKFEIDEHMFLLSGCKLYYEYDRMKVALIIQKIKEI